jgi:DNA-directed RNA polymerase specialized sigma24 family protein
MARNRSSESSCPLVPKELDHQLLGKTQACRRSLKAGMRPSAAEQEAEASLYHVYNPLVEVFIAAFSLESNDAEDCRQASWTAILESLPQFISDGSQGRLCAWIRSIVRSKAADIRRYRAHHPTITIGHEAEGKVGGQPVHQFPNGEHLDAQKTVQKLLSMLRNQVPDLTFSAYHKHWIEQRTVPEIAADLKMSKHEVSWRLYEGMRKIRFLCAHMYRGEGGE